MYDPLTIAMTASAVMSTLQGLKGFFGGSSYDDEARRLGASASSLEKRITASLTRRLAGTPSATARELGRQAEEGIIRQTEQLQNELAREAQRRGIAGSGIAFAQQRLAGERGIRAATGARRGVELADLRGAEQEAIGLADRMRRQQQQLQAQDQLEQQTWGQLLGYGAQILTHQATLKSLTQAGTAPAEAPATAEAVPSRMTFPRTGVHEPLPQVPGRQMTYTGISQAPDYASTFWAARPAAPPATLPFPGLRPRPDYRLPSMR